MNERTKRTIREMFLILVGGVVLITAVKLAVLLVPALVSSLITLVFITAMAVGGLRTLAAFSRAPWWFWWR